MAARDEAARKNDARAFSDAVDALVTATYRGETLQGGDDATRLAAAFILLERLTSQYVILAGPAIATEEGAVEARKVLLSLRSGYEHPVWTYLNGVRSKHKLNRKAPIDDLRRRAYAVGCIRVLVKIDGRSVRAAAKALAERDYFRWHGVTFAALRKWPTELQEPPALDLAERWAAQLVATTHDADDAMRETVMALQSLEAADRPPSLTAAARQRPMYAKLVDESGQTVGEFEVAAQKMLLQRQ